MKLLKNVAKIAKLLKNRAKFSVTTNRVKLGKSSKYIEKTAKLS